MKLKNGKTFEEAIAIIETEKKPQKLKEDKYPYFEYCEYYETLCDALGRDGFVTEYQVNENISLPNGQVFQSATCKIHFLSEAGVPVFSVMGIGTKEITYSEKNGLYTGLNNLGLVTQQAAFKSACKELNIFNCIFSEPEKTQTGKGNEIKQGSDKEQPNVLILSVYLSKALEEVRKDANTGKPVYKMIAQEIIGDSMRKESLEIVFYPSAYAKESMASKWREVSEKAGNKPMRLTMKVTPVKNKENSYVFKSF